MGTSVNSITIELLKKYEFPIQKKYGQNFLIDDNILRGIVDAAGVDKGDTVLEIGPGLGALTGLLCRSAQHVYAVEVDRMLIPILNESLADHENLTLINQDILKVDIEKLIYKGTVEELGTDRPDSVQQKIKVVANLPYYITTPIILQLLEKGKCISSITVMVQKEVAQRMSEQPGSKSYGALSLAVQYYARARYIMTVSGNCFLPKPDVDSAVIRLDIYGPDERPVKTEDPDKMFRIIRAAFNQRRKTLINALSNAAELDIPKDHIRNALQEIGKPETIRGEALTLEEFARLSDLMIS